MNESQSLFQAIECIYTALVDISNFALIILWYSAYDHHYYPLMGSVTGRTRIVVSLHYTFQ